MQSQTGNSENGWFLLSRPCLKGTIQNAETAVVKCPYTDQDYSCDMQLLDREIKSVGNIT